jgi:hypothetical protein
MRTYDQTRKTLLSKLRSKGFSVSSDAMMPLQRIDFAKLVAIHDHEEHFLLTVLIDTLIGLRRGRRSTKADANKITADDIETALRMLGTAAARQAEATLSTATKEQIKNACPWC